MKKIIPIFLAGALALSGCSSAADDNVSEADSDNGDFTAYLDDYVREVCENSYLTMHQCFEDPTAAGIDPSIADVTLGSVTEQDPETEELYASLSSRLNEFDRSELNGWQQQVYDTMKTDFELYERSDKDEYKYLDQIWSEYNSPVNDLVSLFSEYELYSEDDVRPLVELINDSSRYLDDCFGYTKEQAAQGLLMMDYDAVEAKVGEVLDDSEGLPINKNLHDEIDGLDVDDAKKDEYKAEVDRALDESLYAAIEEVPSRLKEFEGQSKEVTGLGNLPAGKEYYEIVLADRISCEDGPDEVRDNLSRAISAISAQASSLIKKDESLLDEAFALKTDFKSVDGVMDWLEANYSQMWPEVQKMDYVLDPLADSQSNDGTAAYFVNPAMDRKGPYRIRYNTDYVADITSVETFATLAHEGIPGHMYQQQYDNEHLKHPVQYLFSCLGYSEGYATYVEAEMSKLYFDNSAAVTVYLGNEELSNFYMALMDLDVNYYGVDRDEFNDKYGELFGMDMDPIYDQLAWMPAVFQSYYYGFYKIDSLRQKAKKELGDKFSNVDFNNALLESGTAYFETVEANVDAYVAGAK